MDKSELKRAIARSTNTGLNQTAYSELAAASQEELNSQIAKEAGQERNRREIFLGAANNWEIAIKAFNYGRKNYLGKKTLEGYLVLLKTFTDWLKETGFETEITPAQYYPPVKTQIASGVGKNANPPAAMLNSFGLLNKSDVKV